MSERWNPSRWPSRRSRAAGALVAATLVAAACNGGNGHPDGSRTPGISPSSSAAAVATRWPIKHVVFIIKENRSFDNFFGRFPGADGVARGRMWLGDTWRLSPRWHGTPYAKKTTTVRLEPRYEWRYPQDLPHDYKQFKMDYRDGHMDGFANNPFANTLAYTQVKPSWIPNYWHWAQQFVLSDRFFASAVGPSFPNHLMTIAATSGGTHDNPWQPPASIAAMQKQGLAKSWGCDIGKGGYVTIYDSEGKPIKKVSPCFDFKTEGDLLNAKGIPWTYYASTNKQKGYIWSAYSALSRYRNDPKMWNAHIKPVDDLVGDIQTKGLDPVTWVTPRFEQSEHPEWNLCYGENWTTRVVDAIMQSPEWDSTAIFITWDDWGGFYDHVKPVDVDAFGFGFRVPMLVISPYAKQGYIDHHVGEFSSVLRFIEDNWGLRQLTDRDQNADNMAYDFAFDQPPRPPDPLPQRKCQGSEWATPASWQAGFVWNPPRMKPSPAPTTSE